MNKKLFEKRNSIYSCQNHIGGLLGEALLRFFLKEGLIKRLDNDYIITDKGWDELEIIGLDIEKLRSIKSKIVNICIESNHGILYEHIGSYLGALLMERLCELGWLITKDGKRFELTDKGYTGFESMGVRIKPIAVQ